MPSQTQPASPQAAKKPPQWSASQPQSKAPQAAPLADPQAAPQIERKQPSAFQIWTQAKAAKDTAQQVLQLLDPQAATGEGESPPDPLDEIKQLLGVMIEALNGQRLQIEALQADVTALRERRYLGRQGGTHSESSL